jgi:hypothetical protein
MPSNHKNCVSTYRRANSLSHQQSPYRLILVLFSVIALVALISAEPIFAHASSHISTSVAASVDPNKGPSELNHHIAGWALIGVGVLQLVALFSPRLKAHRYIWPALFLSAGLFLALWSDGEIWPRGNLNWAWLLQHDAEARQHKVYAVLLIAIGIIEYLRIRGSLPRFWKTWAFPALAVIGACLLLIHDHTAGSGAHSPEAQAYLVNPTLDVDGGPRKPESTVTAAASADDPHHSMHHSSGDARDGNDMESSSMTMDHSQMMMDVPAGDAVKPADHHHMMTASMLLVEREHMWFMIVGLAIGLFKFLSDSEFVQSRIVPYMWPSCMTLLGIMLVLYRE